MINLDSNYLNLNMSYYEETAQEELKFHNNSSRILDHSIHQFHEEHSKVKDKYLKFAPNQVVFLSVLLGLTIGV